MAGKGALKAPDDLIELGRIISAYGIRGWVKVQPHSAQAEVLRAAPIWWLCSPAPPAHLGAKAAVGASNPTSASAAWQPVMQPYAVKQVRPQGASVVADLEGISDRDIAESMRGYTVHVSRNDFPTAHVDEYYWVDLVGCMVYGQSDTDASLIGQVAEVVDNGAHALLRVLRQEQVAGHTELTPVPDEKGRQQEVLIPFVAAHVQKVDIAARRIDTDWPLDF
ncbi:MAG: ribosome maturation factor RimM [Sheuella sp.]|nr:ribosome maturation factor RimM [Sheuella sp.]